jgi:hypothetical protein
MGMKGADDIRACAEHRTMNGEAGSIHVRTWPNAMPFSIHRYQVGCTDLIEQQAIWIEQKAIVSARQAGSDVGVHGIGHSQPMQDPITGCELNADLPFWIWYVPALERLRHSVVLIWSCPGPK